MTYDELSDMEWAQVAALVSDEPPIRINRRGRPRAEPRVVANAVLWILTTGESWSRLPARYPSGPTCRRRFDEWHANGTLAELVRILSACGRAFIYIPEALPVERSVVTSEAVVEDDGLPAVYWKSPDAWQAPVPATEPAGEPALPGDDPIARMTRQLACADAMPDPADAAPRAAGPLFAQTQDASQAAPTDDDAAGTRSAVWISGAARRTEVAEWRGHTMHLAVESDAEHKYRASVEILRDGRRVERSGLVGPPLDDRDAALHYAFDWARAWIDGAAHGEAAAQAAWAAALGEAGAAGIAGVAGAAASARTAVTTPATTADTDALPSTSSEADSPPRAAVTRAAPHAGAAQPGPFDARLAPVRRFVPSAGLPPACAEPVRGEGAGAAECVFAAHRLRSPVG